MTRDEYTLAECKRQWAECQEETYGPWEEQSAELQSEYYGEMYVHLLNIITDEELEEM